MGKFEEDAKQMRIYLKKQEEQRQLLIATRLRAEEQYKKLLNRYVELWGTAIGSITYGKLICVGKIMGYTPQDIQADIDRKRGKKYERV